MGPRIPALHRSVRAAIVPPATFAFTLLVVRDVQVATFSVFGCFALLVMADFGGMRPAFRLTSAAGVQPAQACETEHGHPLQQPDRERGAEARDQADRGDNADREQGCHRRPAPRPFPQSFQRAQ